MDEQERDQLGDGEDDFSQGIKNLRKAFNASKGGNSDAPASKTPDPTGNLAAQSGANQAASQTASQAAQKGIDTGASMAHKGAEIGAQAMAKSAEAANAAAASVKVAAGTGAAVAGIAAGTATGGPWGVIIMAAWSMRHTLFRMLVVICLVLMFLIAMVVSLPSIIFNYIFRTDPVTAGAAAQHDMHELFDRMSAAVADSVTAGYDYSFAKVQQIIADGGHDYELSMQALINHGAVSADYDVAFVLAAYSMSMGQRGTSKQDMVNRLMAVKDQMFLVTHTVRQTTITVPPEDDYSEPTEKTISYVEATIHPFDQSVILRAFDIDPAVLYGEFNITQELAINNMAMALRLTIFGSMTSGTVPPITDSELAAFLANLSNLSVSRVRVDLISTALSLVGRVPYFWGGKSPPGWNNDWNTPRLVTSVGSSSTGTVRPFGLDCTGFTSWVFMTTLGVDIGAGSWNQWANSTAITQAELLPGDLGFLGQPGTVAINHVLMYAGKDSNGNMMWVHSVSGSGVVLDSPTYVRFFRRPNGIDWED